MVNVLGLSVGFHDPAACLVIDDSIVAMAEEERFIRIKHAYGFYPIEAVRYCLNQAGISIKDVDYIALPSNPELFHSLRALKTFTLREPHVWAWRLATAYRYWKNVEKAIRRNFGHVPKIRYVQHHLAHAASAYRVSGFKRANIIVVDGAGELTSTLLAVGKGKEIEKISEVYLPNSLGYLYGFVTERLGYMQYDGEGKVMGLAAYGKPIVDFSRILKIGYGNFKVKFHNIDFKSRVRGEPLNDTHRNIAASLQQKLVDAMLSLTEFMYDQTGYRRVCLAGGVALNADANRRILELPYVDDIFIQPAANDPGAALGAALEVANSWLTMKHNYFGPSFSDEEIEATLRRFKVSYEVVDDIAGYVGEILPTGKTVGWFQGRMEVGPRALGNRSILADPRNPKMKDQLNYQVKHREPWRPFAPSILAYHAAEYFEHSYPAPYMILTFGVKDDKVANIVAATHVDKSARPQTVEREVNPKFHQLIEVYCKQTGVPAIVNTSFNLAGEPIVCSPGDAIRSFYGSGMDLLAIGNCLLKKSR